MKKTISWPRIMFITGVIILIAGAIDPLEGSVIIAGGSALLAFSAYHVHDRHKQLFLTGFLLIIFGVASLFYLSSLGGFGGNSTLSWWWGMLIIPYPVGWLLSIITLIVRVVKKPPKVVGV